MDSKSQLFFSNIDFSCSLLLYLKNLHEEVKKAFRRSDVWLRIECIQNKTVEKCPRTRPRTQKLGTKPFDSI